LLWPGLELEVPVRMDLCRVTFFTIALNSDDFLVVTVYTLTLQTDPLNTPFCRLVWTNACLMISRRKFLDNHACILSVLAAPYRNGATKKEVAVSFGADPEKNLYIQLYSPYRQPQ